MTEICKACGMTFEKGRTCETCGYVKVPIRVILKPAKGDPIVLGVTTNIGKALLKRCVGEESQYASEPQYIIARDTAGVWTICHKASATNATMLDNSPLGQNPVILKAGAQISIMGKACVEVFCEYE